MKVFLHMGRPECRHEDSFLQMYDALGNREEQGFIRQTPGTHCELLVDDPNACNGCPNNPFELANEVEPPPPGWRMVCNLAIDMRDRLELGMTTGQEEEWQLAAGRIAREETLTWRQEIQAKMIAAEVSKMFSGK